MSTATTEQTISPGPSAFGPETHPIRGAAFEQIGGVAFEGHPSGTNGTARRGLADSPGADGGPVGDALGNTIVVGADPARREGAAVAAGGDAPDDLIDLDIDLFDGFRPGLPPLGLSVPRFAPDAVVTVRLPATLPAPQEASTEGKGKRKQPKAFRVPGERSTGPARTEETGITLAHVMDRTAVGYIKARTITDWAVDPSAEIADALLSAGVLTEDDWAGGLDRTVRLGLTRWANREMGMGSLRMLGRLELVYTDDALGYSAGARFPRWLGHFQGRSDRPVGFFGLRWQGAPRPVHVRRRVKALEAVWPGYGYSLMHLLNNAFVSAVNGHSFLWGYSFLAQGEAMKAAKLRRFEALDQDPTGLSLGSWDEMTLDRFGDCLPAEAWKTDFRLDTARRVAAEAKTKAPELAPIAERALALWNACRASGLTFYTLNHHQFLSWEMTLSDFVRGKKTLEHIEHLYRAPTVYTVWDPNNDPMGRMTDDHGESCRSTMNYSDLTWLHGFQIGHKGVEPPAAREQFHQHQKLIDKVKKQAPEMLNMWEPDYKHKPLPDGSLVLAVKALKLVLDIVREIDALLWLLHDPETLYERSRAGLL